MNSSTGTIEQMTRNLNHERSARKRAAALRLCEVLLRNDDPQPGDAKLLAEAVGELGMDPNRLPRAAEAAKKLAACVQLLDSTSEVTADLQKSSQALMEFDANARSQLDRLRSELKAKREPLALAQSSAESRERQVSEAFKARRALEAEWTCAVEGISVEEAFGRLSRLQGIPFELPSVRAG